MLTAAVEPRHGGDAENPKPKHEATIWQKQHGVMVKSDDSPPEFSPCKNHNYFNLLTLIATLRLALHSLSRDFVAGLSPAINGNVRLEGTVRYERNRVVDHHPSCLTLFYPRAGHLSAYREISVRYVTERLDRSSKELLRVGVMLPMHLALASILLFDRRR